ncbi:MAG: nucleotidyltransferase family protein [Mycoplasmatales bacterium]
MEKIGVIMEVNPFHNGHKYFLEQIKKKNQEAYLICVVTTTVTQRGEITVLDKKTKTELLLTNGVDLVVELPLIMANQGGKYYGYYNVKILAELGIDKLVFGSESNNLAELISQSKQKVLQKDFQTGYLKAEVGEFKSNDILGLSYLRAIQKINPQIKIELIQRVSGNYNDLQITEVQKATKICSASIIRKNLAKQEKIKAYLPKQSLDNLLPEINERKLIEILLFQFLNTTNTEAIFLSEHGQIIRKIKKKFEELKLSTKLDEHTLDSLAVACADKNNSKYKIKRIFINVIFQITTKEVDTYLAHVEKYKILGFSKRYTKELKGNQKLFANYKKRDGIYNVNDKVDKILNLYFQRDFKFNYQKPVIK